MPAEGGSTGNICDESYYLYVPCGCSFYGGSRACFRQHSPGEIVNSGPLTAADVEWTDRRLHMADRHENVHYLANPDEVDDLVSAVEGQWSSAERIVDESWDNPVEIARTIYVGQPKNLDADAAVGEEPATQFCRCFVDAVGVFGSDRSRFGHRNGTGVAIDFAG